MAFLDFLFGKKRKTNEFLRGRPERVQELQRFTPQQQNLLTQLLGGVQSGVPSAFDFLEEILSGDPQMMERFEAPSRRAFEERTVPSIAERFTGMNAQKSSAFGQQLGKAAESLEEMLSSQRAGRGFQALSQLQGLAGLGVTPQTDRIFRPRAPGFLESAGSSIAQSLPALLALL